jgi:glycolate oxidase
MLAPVGSISLFHPDGALAAHRVAQRAGTIEFVSTMSYPSLEDVRAGADGPIVFQIYVRGDREWLHKLVNRVMRANYSAICLTVDSAAYGRRERDLHNRFVPAEAHGRPNLSDLPEGADEPKLRDLYQAALTWDDVDWLRQVCPLPLIIKGIQNADDAKLAVEHGASVVYVSNHGGRQIDHVPATIEVLPEIVQAVAGRAEVIVDSGFLRGSDVVKAIALGARAVLIGKLMCWGLGADGEDGLMRTLDLLRIEMGNVMANIGARTIADISREHVRPSLPPLPAPWPVEPYFPK